MINSYNFWKMVAIITPVIAAIIIAIASYKMYTLKSIKEKNDQKVLLEKFENKYTHLINNSNTNKDEILRAINKNLSSKDYKNGKLLSYQELFNELETQLSLLEDFYKLSIEKPHYIKEVCVKLNLLVGTDSSLFTGMINYSNIIPKIQINTDTSGKYYTVTEYMNLLAVQKNFNKDIVKASKLELVNFIAKQGGGSGFSWNQDEVLKELSSEVGISINGIDAIVYELHTTTKTILELGKGYLPIIKENVLVPLNLIDAAKQKGEVGLFSKSIEMYKEAISIIEKMFGKNFYKLAPIYSNLSDQFMNSPEIDSSDEAIYYLLKATQIFEETNGKLGRETLTSKNKLVYAIMKKHFPVHKTDYQSDLNKSNIFIEELKVGYLKEYGIDNSNTIMLHNTIGLKLYQLEKRFDEALEEYNLGLKELKRIFKDNSEEYATLLQNSAILLSDMKKCKSAIERINQAIVIRNKLYETENYKLTGTLSAKKYITNTCEH